MDLMKLRASFGERQASDDETHRNQYERQASGSGWIGLAGNGDPAVTAFPGGFPASGLAFVVSPDITGLAVGGGH